MEYSHTDYSQFPIVVIKFANFEPTVAQFDAYLKQMEHMYTNYEQFIIVFDATDTKYLSGELRAKQAEWIKANTAMIKQNCKGMVYVLPNIAIELIFKCIVAFSPLPVPYKTCRSLQDGIKEGEKLFSQPSM